jgi:Flp pilus assembly protein TadB
MTPELIATALLAALAAGLVGAPRLLAAMPPSVDQLTARADLVVRHRLLWALCASVAGPSLLGGPLGWAVGLGAGLAVWVLVGRAEPRTVRRRREQARQELPHVVQLLTAVLRGGGSVEQALAQVGRALPGPATDALRAAEGRLRVGAGPAQVWTDLAADSALAPLGRALARSAESGASVVDVVSRLSDELAREHRGEVEDLARSVGVRAAVPLGVCLLPAFLLLGIVPVVVASLTALGW